MSFEIVISEFAPSRGQAGVSAPMGSGLENWLPFNINLSKQQYQHSLTNSAVLSRADKNPETGLHRLHCNKTITEYVGWNDSKVAMAQ